MWQAVTVGAVGEPYPALWAGLFRHQSQILSAGLSAYAERQPEIRHESRDELSALDHAAVLDVCQAAD